MRCVKGASTLCKDAVSTWQSVFPHAVFRRRCAECGETGTPEEVSTGSSEIFVFVRTSFLKRVPSENAASRGFGQGFHFSAAICYGYCLYILISYKRSSSDRRHPCGLESRFSPAPEISHFSSAISAGTSPYFLTRMNSNRFRASFFRAQ